MGDITYALGAATVVDVLAPCEVGATGAAAGIDLSAYYGTARVILTATNTSGSSPTLATKLQVAADTDLIGTCVFTGTGTGTCTQIRGGIDCVTEDITVTFSSASAFAVSGSVSGALAAGTVGTLYSTPQITFMITAGDVDFVNLDAFVIGVTARTWSDMTNPAGAFTGLTTVASTQDKVIEVCGSKARYMRVYNTIGGTATPKYRMAVTMLALAK